MWKRWIWAGCDARSAYVLVRASFACVCLAGQLRLCSLQWEFKIIKKSVKTKDSRDNALVHWRVSMEALGGQLDAAQRSLVVASAQERS